MIEKQYRKPSEAIAILMQVRRSIVRACTVARILSETDKREIEQAGVIVSVVDGDITVKIPSSLCGRHFDASVSATFRITGRLAE